jgi:hypothetical protein
MGARSSGLKGFLCATVPVALLLVLGTSARAQSLSGYHYDPSAPPPPSEPAPAPAPETRSSPAPSGVLSLGTQALNFGNININGGAQQTVNISDPGNANVTVTNVIVSGPGFWASGVSSGFILAPGQSTALTVGFSPAGGGSVGGSVTIVTDAGSATVSLFGAGTVSDGTSHNVALSWQASPSSVTGYNAYFSAVSGGPYTRLTSAPVAATNYLQTGVQGGQTYYYVVTSVSTDGEESGYSSEISVPVP